MAFESRLVTICCKRAGSPNTGPAAGSIAVSSCKILRIGSWSQGINGCFNDGRKRYRLKLNPEFSGDNPRHLKQIFDKLRL